MVRILSLYWAVAGSIFLTRYCWAFHTLTVRGRLSKIVDDYGFFIDAAGETLKREKPWMNHGKHKKMDLHP